MNFIEFLEEAQVSKNNLTKMVKLFSKYMGKKLGKGYYVLPYLVDVKGGKGQEVWLEDWRKIRFNWIQGHIKSITIWDDKKLTFAGKKGSRTIHLNGLNVVQMAKKIVDIMKKKSYTGVETHYLEPMYESFQTIENGILMLEAKSRVKPAEFVIMLRDAKISDIKKVSWEEITDVANVNNVNVPGAVRKAPTTGKASNRTYDLSMFMSSDAVKSNGAGIEAAITPKDTEKPIEPMDLEVDREDKLTINIPDISALEAKFADKIAKFDVEQMTDPDYVKFVYDDLENKVNAVAQGLNRLLVLVGGPGLGKTFTTTQILKSYGWKKNTGLYTPSSASALFKVLYMNRNPGDIIVIDDADKVMDDPNAVNLFKQGFNSGGEPFVGTPTTQGITNISKLTDEEKEAFMASTDEKIAAGEDYKLPHLFEYNGSIVFISNRNKSDFNDAVLSRSQFVNMEFTPEQVWLKIEEILPVMPNDDGKMPDLTVDEKTEVFEIAKLFYWKALKKALKDWDKAQSGKEKKKLMDPREIRPTLRFISKGLLYKEISNKTGAGDSWIANLKSAL